MRLQQLLARELLALAVVLLLPQNVLVRVRRMRERVRGRGAHGSALA